MAKTLTLYLNNIQANDFMTWNVFTQCGNTGKVVLRDDDKPYFEAKKDTHGGDLQHLCHGGARYDGGKNLRVEVTVDTTVEIDVSKVLGVITDKESHTVGFVYDFFVEDDIDNDYNDFSINIASWKKK